MALIVPGNRLAYPGRMPGFNPAHPAAQGIVSGHGFSGVAFGNNFINLLSGHAGTRLGTITAAIFGNIGPGANLTSLGRVNFSNQAAVNDTNITLAGIGVITSGLASQNTIISTSTTASGGIFQAYNGSLIFFPNGTNFASASATISLSLNIPYFLAVSYVSAIGRFILLRLILQLAPSKRLRLLTPF